MKRFYVELETAGNRMEIYVMAYSCEQVRDMLCQDSRIACIDETD
jgi:hypothetical protein